MQEGDGPYGINKSLSPPIERLSGSPPPLPTPNAGRDRHRPGKSKLYCTVVGFENPILSSFDMSFRTCRRADRKQIYICLGLALVLTTRCNRAAAGEISVKILQQENLPPWQALPHFHLLQAHQ
jgi:hypothetical protein